ncbi:MAG TPA: sigma-70 family RNA polymerase sigma factor [Blastocatellia bacterium]
MPNLNPTTHVDSKQLVAYVQEAVQWACLRYRRRVRQDELDDFAQQIILKLIEDDCRRLRLFNRNFAFKTWLQAVVNHHVYKRLRRRKPAGIPDELDQGSLIYSPPQDQEIYAAEQRELLFRALCALSEQERLLYNLCFVAEQDAQKIASAFKINVKNVYKRKETLVLKLTRLVQNLQAR